MKPTSLAGICGAFLLTTVSAFGIGPGDNARSFMASDSNLPIQINGSTSAAATAEALVSAGLVPGMHGNVLRGATPENPSLFGFHLGQVPVLGPEGTNDCFAAISSGARVGFTLPPIAGKTYSCKPAEDHGDDRFSSVLSVLDPDTGELVLVSGHVDSWNLHMPVPEVYHSLSRELFDLFGGCETVLDEACAQSGWTWRVTFFPSNGICTTFCCHEQFGIDLTLFRLDAGDKEAVYHWLPPWNGFRKCFPFDCRFYPDFSADNSMLASEHPALPAFRANAGRRIDSRQVFANTLQLDASSFGEDRFVLTNSLEHAGPNGIPVVKKWAVSISDGPWKRSFEGVGTVRLSNLSFQWQRPVLNPQSNPAVYRYVVGCGMLAMFESNDAALSGLASCLVKRASPVSSVIQRTSRIPIPSGICLAYGDGDDRTFIFAKGNVLFEISCILFDRAIISEDRPAGIPVEDLCDILDRILVPQEDRPSEESRE